MVSSMVFIFGYECFQLPIVSTEIKLTTTTTVDIPIEQREPGESAVRGASLTPFVPINEETVFLDADPVTSSGISTMSSPMSCDSWMNYSSNSSDDLSAISDRIHAHQQQQQDSSEESSLEFDTSLAQSTPKAKRNFDVVSEYTLVANRDSANTGFSASADANGDDHTNSASQSKRLRGQPTDAAATTPNTTVSSIVGPSKRKALHRNSSLSGAICDIRMIDFAHTTFMRKNDQMSGYANPTTVQHQGPGKYNKFSKQVDNFSTAIDPIKFSILPHFRFR